MVEPEGCGDGFLSPYPQRVPVNILKSYENPGEWTFQGKEKQKKNLGSNLKQPYKSPFSSPKLWRVDHGRVQCKGLKNLHKPGDLRTGQPSHFARQLQRPLFHHRLHTSIQESQLSVWQSTQKGHQKVPLFFHLFNFFRLHIITVVQLQQCSKKKPKKRERKRKDNMHPKTADDCFVHKRQPVTALFISSNVQRFTQNVSVKLTENCQTPRLKTEGGKLTVSVKVSMNLGGWVSSFVLSTRGDSDRRSSRGISEKTKGSSFRHTWSKHL